MMRITGPQVALLVVIVICIIGASLALFATNHTIRLHNGLGNSDSCSFTAWINCDAAQTSSYALLVGIPVAWWGFLYYIWVGLNLILTVLRRDQYKAAAAVALVLSLVALTYTFYMAYNLAFELKVLCLVCVGMYMSNIVIVLFLIESLELSFEKIPRFLKDYFGRIIGKRINLDFSPHAALYFISAVIIFVAGIGLIKRVYGDSLKLPKMIIVQEVANHFLQTKNVIELDPSPPNWGNLQGSVTVILFSDFECPHCRNAAFYLRNLLWEIRNDVCLYFINYPLDKKINPYVQRNLHSQAGLAARAAVCAHKQGDFWGYHDDIFRIQNELNRESLLALATKRGWNREDFAACMDSDESFQRVRTDIELGYHVNVNSTPTIFVNGRIVKYWRKPEILRAIIREELEGEK